MNTIIKGYIFGYKRNVILCLARITVISDICQLANTISMEKVKEVKKFTFKENFQKKKLIKRH